MNESPWREGVSLSNIDGDRAKKLAASGPRFNKMEETIVNVAGELFDRQGFDRTSMQDIADALGLARSSLYHYFDNKEQILAAGTDAITNLRNQITVRRHQRDTGPTEQLVRLVKEFSVLVCEKPIWIRVLLRDASALPVGARQRDYESRMAFYKLLMETIRAGINEGEIRPVDEEAAALTLLASVTAVQQKYAAEISLSPEDFSGVVVDLLLHGLLNPHQQKGSNVERGLDLIREGAVLIERHERQRQE